MHADMVDSCGMYVKYLDIRSCIRPSHVHGRDPGRAPHGLADLRHNARMIWQPLLEGDPARRALQAVEDIARALEDFTPPVDDQRLPSLAGGAAGEALFHAYLALHTGDEQPAERAAERLDTAVEGVATIIMPPGLYSGFPGVAWVAEHLQTRLFEPDPESGDPYLEIDEALLTFVGTLTTADEYDLIGGVTGLGVYARERLASPSGALLLERVVDHLATQAETGPDGTTWFTPPHRLPEWQREIHPQGLYNLGVAHGIPAVLALLAIACRAGVAADRARPLLDGAVRWLLARQLPAGTASCFGTVAVAGGEPSPSRLAWCYGDPGIAATLLVAAQAAGEPAWEAKALEIARHAARRAPEQSFVRDAGICHGAAGLAHLFNRFWQASGEAVFRDAAVAWIERTLAFQVPGEGIAGFSAWHAQSGQQGRWVAEPGLLEGATGVGLVLLAAVSAVEPEWDRILLVS